MKILDPEVARKELEYFGLNPIIEQDMKHFKDMSDYILPKMICTDEYYKTILNDPGTI